MSENTDTQPAPNYFGPPLKEGEPLARQRGLVRKINMLCEVLEGLRGLRSLLINKPANAPRSWSVYNSDDLDYEEETFNLVTDSGIVTRTLRVKKSTKASVESFSSSDSRLLLSINSDGVVRKSKGYLKS